MRRPLAPRLVPVPVLVAVLVAALPAAACSGDAEPDGGSQEAEQPSGTPAFPGVEVAGPKGEAPTVTVDTPFEVARTRSEVLAAGAGDRAEVGDQATLQYVGVNGRTGDVFDSSWRRGGQPVTLPLAPGTTIPGLLDGLVGQRYGSRVAVAIPPDAGYGPQGGAPEVDIEKDDTLVFVVDLIDAEPPLTVQGPARPLPTGLPTLRTDDDGVPTGFAPTRDTETQLDRLVVAPVVAGDEPRLAAGQTATVHYLGQLYPGGRVVDQSWSRGQPAQLELRRGALIPGLLAGLVGQRVGSRVVVAIPSEQGYGAQGSPPGIPPDADLIFVVDIFAAG